MIFLLMEFGRNFDKSLICSEKALHAQRRFGTDFNGLLVRCYLIFL